MSNNRKVAPATKCCNSRELGARALLKMGSAVQLKMRLSRHADRFTLRSLPLNRAEILGRLSSSLLPPSFVRGRFATLLFFFAGAMGPGSASWVTPGAVPAHG